MSDVTSFTNVNESGADADPAAEGDGEQSQEIPRSSQAFVATKLQQQC